MAKKGTFIKLDRSIQSWRWYTNANTLRVFLHILMNANVVPNEFENVKINRGELATSYNTIANTLNLTKQEIRTAILHLKSTGEITLTKHPKFSVISVVNYGRYQDNQHANQHSNQHSINTQSTHNQHAEQHANQHQYKNNIKNGIKNGKNNTPAGDSDLPGKQYDEQGRELNSMGYPVMNFDVDKWDF